MTYNISIDALIAVEAINPVVSGSLPFADGFVEGEGYCDSGCKAVVWENDLCMYRNECPIGCGTVWVLPGNDG